MAIKLFHLSGDANSSREIDIGVPENMDDLRSGIAKAYAIVKPDGIGFENEKGMLDSIEAILDSDSSIAITVDGNKIREPAGPDTLPIVGNFYEIYPDHLGNHLRLFTIYGSVIKTNNMGTINYLTNDPEIARLAFSENEYFTKRTSDPNHPLYSARDQMALFLCDTDSPAFKISHKFIPPSMSPKAVRHYTPMLQKTVEGTFKVFDELDEQGEAFNVYQYMMKFAGQVISQLVLGKDLHHFDAVDSPLHELVSTLGTFLQLNRKVQTHGTWYSYLPFGDPKRLQNTKARVFSLIEDAIKASPRSGTEDLPIDSAALSASCLVDYLTRATDEKGEKLPQEYVLSNTMVLLTAGFVTTASFLSWLLYSLVSYPGNQEKLLQELVDYGGKADTHWDYDLIRSMPFLDKFVKETQRLHSPAFRPARSTKQDVILPGGFKLPKDAILIPSLPHLERNPEYWNNPERFEPDRWDTEEVKNRHKTLYVPFATGHRGCIGFNVALREVKVALASLVYRYHFEKAGDEPVVYDPEFMVIRPMNFYARAVRRTEWPSPRATRHIGS